MTPWYLRALLVRPARVRAHGDRVCRALGLSPPNDWQLCLGVLRLWHRLLFRSETVGTSPGGRVRATRRARLLANRALRLPALLAAGAVVPLDFTGLGSTPARLVRHLIGAHHDRNQFVYDLELLACYGELEMLRAAASAVVAGDDPRAPWWRDLVVFDGYHEELLAAAEHALAHGPAMTADDARDPDISLRAYLAWCAAQPATPAATLAAWRAGRFRFASPLPELEEAA